MVLYDYNFEITRRLKLHERLIAQVILCILHIATLSYIKCTQKSRARFMSLMSIINVASYFQKNFLATYGYMLI